MILMENVTKFYGKTKAVDDLSMAALPGEITVLLGPNGAGKSTTIKSIAGLLNYQGNISVCGHSTKSSEGRRQFGYIPETPALYDLLNIDEHIQFIRRAYQLDDSANERAEELLRRLELDDKRKKIAKELSKGMNQKVSILLGLMTAPNAVLFDEPMVGLDPQAIEEVVGMMQEMCARGVSVLVSTHIIDMMENLWDRAYIMSQGKLACSVVRDKNAPIPNNCPEDTRKILEQIQPYSVEGGRLKEIFFSITGGGNHNG